MDVRANGVRQESAHASGGAREKGITGDSTLDPIPYPALPPRAPVASGTVVMAKCSIARVDKSPSRLVTGAGLATIAAMSPLGAVAPLPSASTGIVRRSSPGAAIDTRHEGKERGGAGNACGGWGARIGGGGADVSWLTSDTSCIIAYSPSSAVPAALPPPPPLPAVRGPVVGMWVPVNLVGTINSGINIPSIFHLLTLLLARNR